MKVAIVAGEKSGDYLASELIRAMRARYPDAQFVGLCGSLMQKEGATTLAEMEKISIFGLDGLFGSLREILAIRKKLYQYFLDWQPDVFIGVDVPDFNLGLAAKIKRNGTPVVHFVSPTVWAWRGGRINKIRRSIDLMLTLFPFEKTYYQKHDTPVEYVGHPLASQVLNWQVADNISREYGNRPSQQKLIAILPGSRTSEVSKLAPEMLEAAANLKSEFPNLRFVIPAANQKLYDYIKALPNFKESACELILGNSRDVLAVADMAALASGTAALEAALFAKPMVVLYKVSKLSAWVYKNSISVDHFSMPNHLTDQPIIPELIQDNANAENLTAALTKMLSDQAYFNTIQTALAKIAPSLNEESGERACDAIEDLLARRQSEV